MSGASCPDKRLPPLRRRSSDAGAVMAMCRASRCCRSPARITLEDAYIGWKSGELLPSLGKDAIDLSVGSQSYRAGTGFLFYDGGTDGGKRGGYWLGWRTAFRFTGIARLKTGPLLAEAMFLRPYDEPNTSTKLAGTNVEYRFGDRATLGAGYWNVYSSDDARRDGLHVFDLRADIQPLSRLPGLGVAGEIVRERNGSQNNSWGGFAQVDYNFQDALRFSPYIEYRYASFQGDSGSGDNRGFDPLFYGFSDWNRGTSARSWASTWPPTGTSMCTSSACGQTRSNRSPPSSTTSTFGWVSWRTKSPRGLRAAPG